MATSSERAPLLRATSATPSYCANDSSFTRFAATTAVAAPADGAADPSHDHHGVDGRKTGDERMKGMKLYVLLIGLWASNFAFAAQSSAVPTLAPRISLSFSHSELASYLGSIFPLFSTAFTPVYGALLDSVGRKSAMSVACITFVIGTLACGLSPSMGWLIAARAVAGAGGAGVLTVSSVITTDLTSLRERGYYQGLMMIIFGLGASLGGPVAGWLSDNYSWAWAFYAQIPFLVFSLTIILLYLPTPPSETEQPTLLKAAKEFDTLGTFLLLGSISFLLLGFSNHTASLYPWSDIRVWGLLLAFASSMIIFIGFEGKVAKHPIVPLHLFKGQTLPCLYISNFTLSVAAQTFLFHIPIFFTSVLETTSAVAGAHLLPNSIGLALGSLLAGQIIKKTGKYTTLSAIGLAMPILGIYSASKWSEKTPEWAYWAAVFPAGLGYSIFLCCGLVALIASVEPENMPIATSLLYTFRSLGTTAGIALSASLQQAIYVHDLRDVLSDWPGREQIINDILHAKSAIERLPTVLQAQVEVALATSISWTFIAGSIAAFLCLLSSLPIREKDLQGERGKKDKRKVDPEQGTALDV